MVKIRPIDSLLAEPPSPDPDWGGMTPRWSKGWVRGPKLSKRAFSAELVVVRSRKQPTEKNELSRARYFALYLSGPLRYRFRATARHNGRCIAIPGTHFLVSCQVVRPSLFRYPENGHNLRLPPGSTWKGSPPLFPGLRPSTVLRSLRPQLPSSLATRPKLLPCSLVLV